MQYHTFIPLSIPFNPILNCQTKERFNICPAFSDSTLHIWQGIYDGVRAVASVERFYQPHTVVLSAALTVSLHLRHCRPHPYVRSPTRRSLTAHRQLPTMPLASPTLYNLTHRQLAVTSQHVHLHMATLTSQV